MMRNSEQCLHETVAKRRNLQKISLSDLPMDILSTILSLLPINDAIRTSVLSRKLKYVWCSHTNLTFDKATMRKTYFKPSTGYYQFLRDHEFVTRVNTVLRQHSGTGVERMEIKFRLHSKHADHIDRWVNFAIASKAKELVIDLSCSSKDAFFRAFAYGKKWIREEPYNLTSQFFSPSNGLHLQCLELMAVSLHLPSDFKGFPNLKSLSLVDVSITDEDVECMLSKCNLLEFFEITHCRMVTSIRMLHPLNRFKHLVVHVCPKLQEIELNCSPTTLKYAGDMVPLIFASTSRLKNIDVVIFTVQSALSYIVTGFPSTLPSLETLTLLCYEPERTIVPEGHFKFSYLRNLRLELVMCDDGIRTTDFLDYAYLLKIAPFLETLELHMWMMMYWHQPYCKEDGELRIGLPHKHAHLKFVRISGFFGYKDQVELALHILRNSVALEKMEITPKLEISYNLASGDDYERSHYVDSHRVATEFICKADHRNVVNVVRVPSSSGPDETAMEVDCRAYAEDIPSGQIRLV
ncbi:hypothetical protein GQ55_1G057000 [Panicum hallii var. hallii]|uniref:F-box domain-containing protein n=1 Tax=Panicum hallii var. hallii TaxID=1504633 RepID=A0A2T7F2P3_9POAL|nr:hypothetical protein GQ55_1G057000 [Panicum hallii var. hallii]PUZ74340.1 hypothetical protein GQ55_1G057000 [Panicum hallii var. hallii]